MDGADAKLTILGCPYRARRIRGALSEGVALGYDGSGRWPDNLPVIERQKCLHLSRRSENSFVRSYLKK